MTAALWCLMWLGVAVAMAIALGIVYEAVDRAIDAIWPTAPDYPDNEEATP